ncbi:MAG: PHP domain-containing protein, partial [Longimicrobiales bacterium]
MKSSDLLPPLGQLADLADIRGSSIEAAAWRRLAADIERGGPGEAAHLRQLAHRNQLAGYSNIPSGQQRKLRDLLLADAAAVIRAEWTELPWLIRRLLEFGIVDIAGAASLARLGVITITDLEGGLQDGRIAGHLSAHQGRLRIAAQALSFERPRVPLGRASDLVDHFIRLAAVGCPDIAHLTAAGDLRRFEPLVESLIVVGSAADPPDCLNRIASAPAVQHVLHRTSRRAILSYQKAEIDLRIAATDELGTTLLLATGSLEHLTALRARQGAVRLCAREEEVYAQAGLQWIPPEMRNGTGEIEAAATGALPALVTREHIRGDLHIHSTYSDGRDSLAEMVQTCAALGYEYIAITDHSERAAAARTVTIDALARQRDEIARLKARFPAMTILHGIEVDIMPDGSLDFPDRVLESLDIVLASLHDRAGHDPGRLTERCLAAITHPLVNIITHPANRLVGHDPGYEMDFDAVYAAAAATGTALEIDGAPNHLDMDGEHARAAVAAGVTVAIDSDCHRARLLGTQMRLGIGTARRGWVEPR